jgi:hypothetical protein
MMAAGASPQHAVSDAVSASADELAQAVTLIMMGLFFGLPLLGYVFMAIDIRRWLRSLRRALVLVQQMATDLPGWAQKDSPACLDALGLTFPCSTAEVTAAYRRKVKDLHPDRGGQIQDFLRLQRHFEQALQLAIGGNQSASGGEEPRAPGG